MLDYSKPFGAGNTEQELVAGLETFDPFASYTESTVAAFYVGSCYPSGGGGGGGTTNNNCQVFAD